MIAAEGLTVRYGRAVAVDTVDVSLGSGIIGLVGVNGAGKSTLLTTLAGARRPDAGRVRVHGSELYGRARSRAALSRVALVPQLPHFPRSLTAREVVSYLAWMRGTPSRECDARAREALARVGLEQRTDTRMGVLSGGMQRRVALAQALASDADVLLLDEPSTGLDPRQRRTMVELLRGLAGTVLISSHVMEDVADLAHRVLVLDQGRLKYDGSLDGLRALAPAGTPEHRSLEAGFLSLGGGMAT